MSLRSELKNIDPDVMSELARETMPIHFFDADRAAETEAVLKADYPGLYESSHVARALANHVGRTPEEARLIATGMVMQLALIKDYAERAEIEGALPQIPPKD